MASVAFGEQFMPNIGFWKRLLTGRRIARRYDPSPAPIIYNTKEAAKVLKTSPKTLRGLMDDHEIGFFWLGKRRRLTEQDTQQYAAEHGSEACQSTSRKAPRTSNMTSNSGVIGFTEARRNLNDWFA